MPLTNTFADGKFRIEHVIDASTDYKSYVVHHLERQRLELLRTWPQGQTNTAEFGSTGNPCSAEAMVAARVAHSNMLTVYEQGEWLDTSYVLVEYSSGGSLAQALSSRRIFTIAEVVKILGDVAVGLQAMHDAGIVHRDVHPGNLYFGSDGVCKVGGLARAQVRLQTRSMQSKMGTAGGPVAHPGTIGYMSPEHGAARSLVPTSDVYSLGCTVFELLTGVQYATVQESVPLPSALRPDVPAWLDTLVARMVLRQPGIRVADRHSPVHRFSSMEAVLTALRDGSSCVVSPYGRMDAPAPTAGLVQAQAANPNAVPAASASSRAAPRSWHRQLLPYVLAVAIGLGIGTSAFWYLRNTVPQMPMDYHSATQRDIPSEYAEAPGADRTADGRMLPPVAERLPRAPFVVWQASLSSSSVISNWTPGIYGGVMQLSMHRKDDLLLGAATLDQLMFESLLVCVGSPGGDVVGNVLYSYTVSSDARVFTFRMREGMRWSDGTPVTSEDLRFTIEHVNAYWSFHSAAEAEWPVQMRAGGYVQGAAPKVRILDDYTFQFEYVEPYGSLIDGLVAVDYETVLKPAHYYRRFHPDFASAADRESWPQMVTVSESMSLTKLFHAASADAPTLRPWVFAGNHSATGVERAVRNSFYWKVDSSGQQLPYIEAVSVTRLASRGIREVGDQIDVGAVVEVSADEAAAIGNPSGSVQLVRETKPLIYVVSVNLNAPGDGAVRSLLRDVRFRRAMSAAIDRSRFVQLDALGPVQAFSGVFDRSTADQLLDEIGLTRRDVDGFRLGVDGRPFKLRLFGREGDRWQVAAGMRIVDDLAQVGLKVEIQSASKTPSDSETNWDLRLDWIAGEGAAKFAGSGAAAGSGPYPFADSQSLTSPWPTWAIWEWSYGVQGEQPPDEFATGLQLDARRREVLSTSSEAKMLVVQAQQWWDATLPAIPIVRDAPGTIVYVPSNLQNVEMDGSAELLGGCESCYFTDSGR